MKKIIFIVLSLFSLCTNQFCFAQPDNGNHFEKTWGADVSKFQGSWGEIGLYAPENLDIDKDGFNEFVVYDHVIGFQRFDHLQVWEAKGDNDFWLAWQVTYTDWQTQWEQGHGLTVADLDFDGNLEVLIATEGNLYIYEHNGTTFESGGGLPQQPTQTYFPLQDNEGNSEIRRLNVAELDGDPELEIFMGYGINQGVYCVIGSIPNSDLSSLDWEPEFADNFPWQCGGVLIDDFDGDGNMEIFTCHWQDAPTTRLYESNGPNTYAIKSTTLPENLILNPSFDDAYANPVFYDFDKDGNKEIVLTDIHGKVWVITKEASNNFEYFGPSAWTFLMQMPTVLSNSFVRSGWLGDLDQDGKPDIYYNDKEPKAVLDLEYQSGPVTDPNSWIYYEIYKGHRFVLGYCHPAGDLDGDGKGELVIAANGGPNENLQVIENTDAPTVVMEQNISLPRQIELCQNYPNPFNSQTHISYRLSEPGGLCLEIYSPLGQKVQTIERIHQTAGYGAITFEAAHLPSGVYFYRLVAGNLVHQKKMLLIR